MILELTPKGVCRTAPAIPSLYIINRLLRMSVGNCKRGLWSYKKRGKQRRWMGKGDYTSSNFAKVYHRQLQIQWTKLYLVKSVLGKNNPAYGRHQLSRQIWIVGLLKFWRGCVIYRSAPKSGFGPYKNADSVHAKVGTRSTQKCWLGSLRNISPFFRALLEIQIEIEIELQNTSSFLGLYSRSRSRSNSGTHPRF